MPRLFGILIFVKEDNIPRPYCQLNEKNELVLRTYPTLQEADFAANQIDPLDHPNTKIQARVISLDSVHE